MGLRCTAAGYCAILTKSCLRAASNAPRFFVSWPIWPVYLHIFSFSLRETRIVIEQWRKHYNTKRPQYALGYQPPAPETIVEMDYKPAMN